VPELVKALDDNEAARREAAAEVLGRIGPPARAAVPSLIAALKDKSSAVALTAAMALAQIDATRASAAVSLLADSLDVPGAAVALANIGPDARAAVPALIAALKPRKEAANQETLHAGMRLALARIGTPAVPDLIEALKDRREGVAPTAGGALGWILPPPKEAVLPLREALKNDRAHAAVYAHALGQLGPLARPAVPDLTDLLTDPAARAEAAVALVRMDSDQTQKAVALLVKEIQATDEKQRLTAVLALARLGPAAHLSGDDLKVLLRDRRLTEIEILALREIWAGAIPALVELLKDAPTDCRLRTLFALEQIGPAARAAVTPLTAALSDRDYSVRVKAAQILQEIGPEASEAVPALIANLQITQMEVRATAAAALGHIGPGAKDALRPLMECLLDPDTNVRYATTLSLGRIDPHFNSAVPALRDALHDLSPDVQLAAIDSLSRIEPAASKETEPILVALSRKPYPSGVRFRAVDGMIHVLGAEAAKQAVPWLAIELTDVDPENFLYAARLLAVIDTNQTSTLVLALASALRTPVPEARKAILHTLGEFGSKAREVVPDIEQSLYDGTPGVRPEAIRTLRAINPAKLKQLGVG
jgi:HEAT repeat protein